MFYNISKTIAYLLKLTIFGLLLAVALPSAPAHCGSWRVIPIRLDFDQRARSGVVTITNDSDEKINFSVDAREWTQDAEGKDQYSETSDILFFPKALSVNPHEERIIRAGIKVPAIKQEKTYRLFIKQETPPEEKPGTAVAIAIKFGLPIFSKPPAEEVKGEITQAALQKGKLTVGIKNSGNTHFRIKSIHFSGKDSSGAEIFSQDLEGWYLLTGASRLFTASIPEGSCGELRSLDIQVTSDRINLNGKIDVDKAMCLTQ